MLQFWVSLIPAILKAFGFIDAAETMILRIQAKKKAQDFANMPTTKQERTDAANRGDL